MNTITVTDKIKTSIRCALSAVAFASAESVFFYLDDHLGLIDEEYHQCLFPEDEFGGIIYDSTVYSKIEAAIMAEINHQLNYEESKLL